MQFSLRWLLWNLISSLAHNSEGNEGIVWVTEWQILKAICFHLESLQKNTLIMLLVYPTACAQSGAQAGCSCKWYSLRYWHPLTTFGQEYWQRGHVAGAPQCSGVFIGHKAGVKSHKCEPITLRKSKAYRPLITDTQIDISIWLLIVIFCPKLKDGLQLLVEFVSLSVCQSKLSLCVYNQWVYANNLVDVVDQLLILLESWISAWDK